MTFDFSEALHKQSLYEVDGEMELELSGSCNGVVLWMDYRFQEDMVLSSGLLSHSVSLCIIYSGTLLALIQVQSYPCMLVELKVFKVERE